MEQERNTPYLLFMLFLSLIAIGAFVISTFAPISPDTKTILRDADTALCVIFFVDFVVSFAKAKHRIRYLYTWGWLDLLSSIPALDSLRWTRSARIVRIIRVLRGIRAARTLTSFLVQRRAQSTFFAALIICLVLVVVSSAAIVQLETVESSNIHSASDALWWSIVTITTVGYGDRFPVTPEGRAIGALLMTAGVGLFGTFSGFVASWFLQPSEAKSDSELKRLVIEVALLREEVSKLRPTQNV